MFKDREGHIIEICRIGNGHVMVYGNTGQGKTFLLCRMLEDYCRKKKKVLIIDFSGSYTDKELKEKGFLYQNRIRRYDLNNGRMQWVHQTSDKKLFLNDVADALLEILRCKSYFQRKLLIEAIERVMKHEGMIRISDLVGVLEEMLSAERQGEKTTGNTDNLNRLITRLYPYCDIDNFELWSRYTTLSTRSPVTIIDVSSLPEGQRRFLTGLMVSLLWREVYRQEKRNKCDVLVLDEMQFLPVNDGSTLSSMLREGRKRNLAVVLSTQFIGNYSEAEKSALMQADTKIIFHPTPEDCRYSAQIIDPVNLKIWEPILHQLQKCEALLKGHYRINNRSRVCDTPIVIRAVPQIEVMKEDEVAYARKTIKKVHEGGEGD